MKYSPSEIETYYRLRLDPYGLRHYKGNQWRCRCAVHQGENPTSLMVDFSDGHYYCFSRKCSGKSIFHFEMEMLRQEMGQVPGNDIISESIARIIGTPLTERVYSQPLPQRREGSGWDRALAQASYRYTNLMGEEVFTVWRFRDSHGNKATPPDHPSQDGRIWGLEGCPRVLYRWPDLVASSLVFVVEGEKNADDLHRALAMHISKNHGFRMGRLTLDRVAVTTNVGGASGWKQEYNYGREFQSKVVVKLGDNDVAGRKHTEDVCRDLSRFAGQLFTMDLPVGEGEDISDYLAAHSVEEFLKLLANPKPWAVVPNVPVKMPKDVPPRIILVPPSHLIQQNASQSIDWLVEGLIERNTRGLVVAPPKVGKSLLFLDMAVSLSTGTSFLDIRAYHRPVRTAIVSREDGPVLVHRRLSNLCAGRGLTPRSLDSAMLINTEKQSSTFKIDNQKDLDEMAEWLRAGEIEFCVIDVLNRLHLGKENSTDDMTAVMLKFDELGQKSGSQICVIHHSNAAGNSRGSSAITGWADYIVRMERDAEDDSIKRMFVATKSIGQIMPRTLKYWQSPDESTSKIMLVVPEQPAPKAKGTPQKHWADREEDGYAN